MYAVLTVDLTDQYGKVKYPKGLVCRVKETNPTTGGWSLCLPGGLCGHNHHPDNACLGVAKHQAELIILDQSNRFANLQLGE